MFIARISRQSGDKVIKDEISMDNLLGLFGTIATYREDDILEIHIFREDKT